MLVPERVGGDRDAGHERERWRAALLAPARPADRDRQHRADDQRPAKQRKRRRPLVQHGDRDHSRQQRPDRHAQAGRRTRGPRRDRRAAARRSTRRAAPRCRPSGRHRRRRGPAHVLRRRRTRRSATAAARCRARTARRRRRRRPRPWRGSSSRRGRTPPPAPGRARRGLLRPLRRREPLDAGRQPPLLLELLEVGLERDRGGEAQLARAPPSRPRRAARRSCAHPPPGRRAAVARDRGGARGTRRASSRGSSHVRAVTGAEHVELELAQAPQRVEVGRQRTLPRRMKTLPLPSTVSPVKQIRPAIRQTWSAAWPGVASARNGPTCCSSRGRTIGTSPPASARERLGALGVVGVPVGEHDPVQATARGRQDRVQVAGSAGPGSTTQLPQRRSVLVPSRVSGEGFGARTRTTPSGSRSEEVTAEVLPESRVLGRRNAWDHPRPLDGLHVPAQGEPEVGMFGLRGNLGTEQGRVNLLNTSRETGERKSLPRKASSHAIARGLIARSHGTRA